MERKEGSSTHHLSEKLFFAFVQFSFSASKGLLSVVDAIQTVLAVGPFEDQLAKDETQPLSSLVVVLLRGISSRVLDDRRQGFIEFIALNQTNDLAVRRFLLRTGNAENCNEREVQKRRRLECGQTFLRHFQGSIPIL